MGSSSIMFLSGQKKRNKGLNRSSGLLMKPDLTEPESGLIHTFYERFKRRIETLSQRSLQLLIKSHQPESWICSIHRN